MLDRNGLISVNKILSFAFREHSGSSICEANSAYFDARITKSLHATGRDIRELKFSIVVNHSSEAKDLKIYQYYLRRLTKCSS